MTDEMTPERLAEIRARVKATTEGPWSFHPNHAFADPSDPLYVAGDGTVIADDISRKNNAVFIAHSRTDVPALIAEVERLRKENEGARRAAASFKAWDLARDVDRLTRELEAAEARATAAEAKLAEAEERAVKAVIALGEIARAVMKEVEPTMGERMRCVRLARAFLASPDEEKSDA